MPEPHVTYYIKVADNGDGVSQNEFFISGSGDTSWSNDFNRYLEYHNDCGFGVTGMKIYKFDQSDPSNANHPFYLSIYQDGTHGGGNAADVLGSQDGVYHCGVPGNSGASTKVNMPRMWQSSNFYSDIYPFCPNHSAMGGTSYFTTNNISGDECVSGDYPCSGECTLESYLTGILTGLIHSTNVSLSGEYSDYNISSYSISTGVQAGPYEGCAIFATGATEAEANSRRTTYANEFYYSGKCYDDRLGENALISQTNTSNAPISFNTPTAFSGANGTWFSSVTGFFSSRYYVNYNPVVSGQKTVGTVDVDCPSTTFDVTLERDRQMWSSTGTAAKGDDVVRKLNVTLNTSCSGYETNLTAGCEKVRAGVQQYCNKTISNSGTACWEDDFEEGEYKIKYISGAYQTNNNNFMIGTGHLDVSEII
jgi:hypothetical protein